MDSMARQWFVLFVGAGLGLAGACGDDDAPSGSNNGGEGGQVEDTYYVGAASMALGAPMNEADCALCHSDNGDQEGFPGNTFVDIAYKTDWKGGGARTLLDAANACVTGWMGGEALTASDEAWLSLEVFLMALSDPEATTANALAPEVLADEAAYESEYAGGDAGAGETAYAVYCSKCHDGALTVGGVPAWSREALASRTVGRIAQKVRTAGPPPSGTEDSADSTPGPMPFFEPRDLPSDALRDIIAYIRAEE